MNIKNDVKMATSSIRITKICQWCGVEFEAQKVSTKYCSHRCANLAYKQAVRDKRVKQAEAETLSIKLEKPIENVKDKEYLSFAQAGKLLGLSRQAVYNMVKAGKLKASKISSRLSFIKRTDIDAMLENKPYKTLHPKDSVPITDFYTTAEVKEKLRRNIISLAHSIVARPTGVRDISTPILQRRLQIPILQSGIVWLRFKRNLE